MEKVEELIQKKTAVNYRKAAKIVSKEKLEQYGQPLMSFLIEVLPQKKKWETSCEIIKSLGIIKYKPAAEIFEQVLEENQEHDMVTMASSTAYIRLKRESLNDGSLVIDLLKTKGYSIREGALEALGYDKMVPPREQQMEIIGLCWDFGKNRDAKGYADPRYALAAACAGWDASKVNEFLEHCLASGDVPLKYVAERSLQRKYVKLR